MKIKIEITGNSGEGKTSTLHTLYAALRTEYEVVDAVRKDAPTNVKNPTEIFTATLVRK